MVGIFTFITPEIVQSTPKSCRPEELCESQMNTDLLLSSCGVNKKHTVNFLRLEVMISLKSSPLP